MKKKITLLVLSMFPFILGCTAKVVIREGEIIDKSYQSSWVQNIKVGQVNTVIIHKEKYSVKLSNDVISQWIHVDRSIYDSVRVGDYVIVDLDLGDYELE